MEDTGWRSTERAFNVRLFTSAVQQGRGDAGCSCCKWLTSRSSCHIRVQYLPCCCSIYREIWEQLCSFWYTAAQGNSDCFAWVQSYIKYFSILERVIHRCTHMFYQYTKLGIILENCPNPGILGDFSQVRLGKVGVEM